MICYAIKNGNLYKTTTSSQWTKDISKCAKWDTFEKANKYVYGCYLRTLPNIKVVKVEIREVWDE